jgi:hypothetical protein
MSLIFWLLLKGLESDGAPPRSAWAERVPASG